MQMFYSLWYYGKREKRGGGKEREGKKNTEMRGALRPLSWLGRGQKGRKEEKRENRSSRLRVNPS